MNFQHTIRILAAIVSLVLFCHPGDAGNHRGGDTFPDLLLQLDDETLAWFLATSPIVAREDISKGVSGIQRLTLRRGETELRAAFKTVDRFIGPSRPGSNLERMNRADRYQYDIAAYRLDRLLGIHMVPVTAYREIDGEGGAITLWIENAINDEERERRDLTPGGNHQFLRSIHIRYVFDILIYNEDRNRGNILYTLDDGRTHLIDHSRAFRTSTRRPDSLAHARIVLPGELAERLAALDLKTARQRLEPWINKVQIKAMLKRRDRILEEWSRTERLSRPSTPPRR